MARASGDREREMPFANSVTPFLTKIVLVARPS